MKELEWGDVVNYTGWKKIDKIGRGGQRIILEFVW